MNRKLTLLALIIQADQMAQDFLQQLPPEAKHQSGSLADWSAKDVVAHIYAWNERLAANLHAVVIGKDPIQTADFDHENAQLFAKYQDWSWEAVLAFAATAHQQVHEQIEALSEADLDGNASASTFGVASVAIAIVLEKVVAILPRFSVTVGGASEIVPGIGAPLLNAIVLAEVMLVDAACIALAITHIAVAIFSEDTRRVERTLEIVGTTKQDAVAASI